MIDFNIYQEDQPDGPTSNVICPCLTNQQLPWRFTPGRRSTDAAPTRARLIKSDLAAFDAAAPATKLEFGGRSEEEGEDLVIS